MPAAMEGEGARPEESHVRDTEPRDVGRTGEQARAPATGASHAPPELDRTSGPNRAELRGSEAIIFYHSMFKDVPIWSGQEWVTMPASEIAERFKVAARQVVEAETYYQRTQERAFATAQREYQALPGVVRFFVKEPSPPQHKVPTLGEVQEEMAKNCERLAFWMDSKQHSRFYMSSDMSAYTRKPREVAAILRQPTAEAAAEPSRPGPT